MAVTIKTRDEISLLREGGRRLAEILKDLSSRVAPGVSAKDLDMRAREMVKEFGDAPAFLNYKPYGAKRPYPAVLCVSINDEVVHGVPNEKDKILKGGDIVSLDMGLVHKKMYTDMAVTVPVGEVSLEAKKLLSVTEQALAVGIKAVRPGAMTGDVGHAIESFVRPYKFGIIQELAGHGVGYSVHEDPYVPNYGTPQTGIAFSVGMVIAIEPMLTSGSRKVILDADGFTYKTKDGSLSAHFEKTVVVTDSGVEVLTAL